MSWRAIVCARRRHPRQHVRVSGACGATGAVPRASLDDECSAYTGGAAATAPIDGSRLAGGATPLFLQCRADSAATACLRCFGVSRAARPNHPPCYVPSRLFPSAGGACFYIRVVVIYRPPAYVPQFYSSFCTFFKYKLPHMHDLAADCCAPSDHSLSSWGRVDDVSLVSLERYPVLSGRTSNLSDVRTSQLNKHPAEMSENIMLSHICDRHLNQCKLSQGHDVRYSITCESLSEYQPGV